MAKPTIFAANALLGGADGALDSINGAILVDKDLAVVVDIDNFYPYQLDVDSAAGENSPLVIAPDANPGDKRWILKKGVFAGLELYGNVVMPDGGTIGQAAGPLLTFDNTNDFLEITGCKVGIGTIPGAMWEVYDPFTQNPSLVFDSLVSWELRSSSVSLVGSVDVVFPWSVWLQARGSVEGSVPFPISLNPLGGNVVIGGFSPKTLLTVEGTITLKEQAAADADTATYGQIWVDNSAPCRLRFTNDTGGDFYAVVSDAGTGGAESAGAGKQYIEMEIAGSVYKVLHDGTV